MPRLKKTEVVVSLIDDDELVRISWSLVAGQVGDRLVACANLEEFLSHTIELDVPVYVDYLLADGVKGSDVATELLRRGYQKVFLATGLPLRPDQIPEGIAGVVGKEYPVRK